ncbi:MAG: hypothetical protein GY859_24785, partial [Desulfobacterales bacterium]|nr:hypothetical protein [Desulfobacterales bacterium]
IPILALLLSRVISLSGAANVAFYYVSRCCGSIIITYAVLGRNLYDPRLLFIPFLKSEKYYFHGRLSEFTKNGFKVAYTHGRMAKSLSCLFGCDVAVNIDGKPASAEGGGNAFKKIDAPAKFLRDPPGSDPLIFTGDVFPPGRHADLKRLADASVAAFHVIPMAGGSYCLIKFGPGVKEIVYSVQDMKRLRTLWGELEKCLLFISMAAKKRQESDSRVKALENELVGMRDAVRDEGIDFRKSPPGPRGVALKIALFGDLVNRAPTPRTECSVLPWDGATPVEAIREWAPHVVMIEGRRMENNRRALDRLNLPMLVITDRAEEIMEAHRLFPRLLIEYAAPERLAAWTDILDIVQALAAVDAATLYQKDDQRLISRNREI